METPTHEKNETEGNVSTPVSPQEGAPEKNIYGKIEFERSEGKKYIDFVNNKFRDYYLDVGYVEHPAALISSGIDPTVRFIGSPISVFKEDFLKGKIPDPGEFMIQECIRTKSISETSNDSFSFAWSSHFPGLGVISSYDRLDQVTAECFAFLIEKLGINKDCIRILMSSKNVDLMSACTKCLDIDSLKLDSEDDIFYRHKIGIENVSGRNLGITMKKPVGDDFAEIGNIIILERGEDKLCVEVALGTTVILKELYSLDHINDCYPIPEIEIESKVIRRKLEDSIVVSVILYREGLRPKGTGNRDRLLRSYVRSISYLRARAEISMEKIGQLLLGFESAYFLGKEPFISEEITTYLNKYEDELLNNGDNSKEEIVIIDYLKRNK